jgi:hypothetical protein
MAYQEEPYTLADIARFNEDEVQAVIEMFKDAERQAGSGKSSGTNKILKLKVQKAFGAALKKNEDASFSFRSFDKIQKLAYIAKACSTTTPGVEIKNISRR